MSPVYKNSRRSRFPVRASALSCLVAAFLLFSCARDKHYVKILPSKPSRVALPGTAKGVPPESYVVRGERYYPLPDSDGFVETGKASWYGKEFHGRPTSCGEIYDMHRMTAAHKTLPLGTYVKVVNLTNGRHTVVRINDRGPFIPGRIIDLSYAAASELGMIRAGVVDVKIQALGREVHQTPSGGGSGALLEFQDMERGEFTVQVGAFEQKENALELVRRLGVLFDYVGIQEYVDLRGKTLYRVHVSKAETLTRAGDVEKRLRDMGFEGAFVMRL